MGPVRIAPSLLAADFADLGAEVRRVGDQADMLHLDVMDGHFVPNLTFGMPVIRALRAHTDLPFDCHLMTTNPDAYLPELAAAGADLVTMHIEAISDPTEAAKRARGEGLRFGLVLSPPTPWQAIEPFLELCDLVLVMSVNPGFGGQTFMPEVLPKVEAIRKRVDRHGLAVDIEIDGGITASNAAAARAAGAEVFVAGTSVFGAEDPAAAIRSLREAIEGSE
ncbi:MAG: ribulose-phosphate 3-epimerase [Acidimicrobiia bacterium]|jgi:ribulose-phosphate 3-epimerase